LKDGPELVFRIAPRQLRYARCCLTVEGHTCYSR
jgi:hypothetical protein